MNDEPSSPDEAGGTNPSEQVSSRVPTLKCWKPHLDSYKELRALTFASEEQMDAAIDLLWTDELRELPHDLAGGDTLIIPAEAVTWFARAGLKFQDKRVRPASEWDPEKLARLRREQGPY